MPLEFYGVNTSIVPTGDGWWYPQPFGDGVQRIPARGCAGSAEKLCQEVLRFRAMQGIPTTGYERDIAEHMRSVSPMNRISKTVLPPKTPEPPRSPIISRITHWLIDVSRRQPRVVRLDEATERAAICAECRQNVKWETACRPCIDEVKDRGSAVRQRTGHQGCDSLKACRLHDLYLPAAVFLDREFLPSKTAETPPECWLPNP